MRKLLEHRSLTECALIVLGGDFGLLEQNSIFKGSDELHTAWGENFLEGEEAAERFFNNWFCLAIVTTGLKACCSSIMFRKCFV